MIRAMPSCARPACYPYPREMEPEQLQRGRPCRCTCEVCSSTHQTDRGPDDDMIRTDGTVTSTPSMMEEYESEAGESEPSPEEAPGASEAGWLSAHDQLIIDHGLNSTTTPDTTMVEVQCYCHHEVDPAGTVPRSHCRVTRWVTYRHATEDQDNVELCLECYPYPRDLIPESLRLRHP